MGKNRLSAPERLGFYDETAANYATFNLWGKLAYWAVLSAGMAAVYALAGLLIYGSPLGPLASKVPAPSPEARSLPVPPAG